MVLHAGRGWLCLGAIPQTRAAACSPQCFGRRQARGAARPAAGWRPRQMAAWRPTSRPHPAALGTVLGSGQQRLHQHHLTMRQLQGATHTCEAHEHKLNVSSHQTSTRQNYHSSGHEDGMSCPQNGTFERPFKQASRPMCTSLATSRPGVGGIMRFHGGQLSQQVPRRGLAAGLMAGTS